MTTDADEGRRQAEAMKPEPLKVGDKVRLAAGVQHMTVVALEDYGNSAVCELQDGPSGLVRHAFSARSLVKVDDGNIPAPAAGEAAEAPKHRPQEGHAEQGNGQDPA